MPDTSTSNSTHGWFHDSQFVIRLPNDWNGKLVITGAPGTRKQYASDPIVSDWVLSKGYAYASTDKGNGGAAFYEDGEQPGDAGAEWNFRVTEIAVAAKAAVARHYGRPAARTYITGISQGGYLTRWQLENRPDLYDGGVDWEGTLWHSQAPNLFTTLPPALRHYPRYRATGDPAAYAAMIAAGFAPGSEFLWEDHYAVYWDLTQRVYREELDPSYDGALEAGIPFCQPGTPFCDADYDYSSRPPEVKAAMAKIDNTGRIGKPMISLHGTLDSLLPITVHGDRYRRLVERAGRADLHRYWVIENGNHVDGRYDSFPERLRPLWPCWTEAFAALEGWVERGVAPPRSQYVPDAHAGDIVNHCTIPEGAAVPGPGPFPDGDDQVARRAPRVVVVKISGQRRRGRAGRAGKGRFRRFSVRGRVVRPAGVTREQACGSGTVRVRVTARGRRLATRRARLRRSCGFALRVKVRRRGVRRARFAVRFSGNRALFAARARPRYARIR